MFRMLGNGELSCKIINPNDNTSFLFLSFDQNHSIKKYKITDFGKRDDL